MPSAMPQNTRMTTQPIPIQARGLMPFLGAAEEHREPGGLETFRSLN